MVIAFYLVSILCWLLIFSRKPKICGKLLLIHDVITRALRDVPFGTSCLFLKNLGWFREARQTQHFSEWDMSSRSHSSVFQSTTKGLLKGHKSSFREDISMCLCVSLCALLCAGAHRDQKRVLVFSFHQGISGNQSQFVSLGSKELQLLSHLRTPQNCFTVTVFWCFHSSPCIFSLSPWLILPVVAVSGYSLSFAPQGFMY